MASKGRAVQWLGIAMIVAGMAVFAWIGDPEEDPVGIAAALVAIAGILLNFRGRRLNAKAAKAASAVTGSAPGTSPEVLYLRPFTVDTSSSVKVLQSGLSTEEEQLALALRPFGKLVAIGKPGEGLPLPGAERVYASDDEWKNVVLRMMSTARLVVLSIGAGRGLEWELVQSFERLSPDKLVLLVLRTARKDYEALGAALKAASGIVLPAIEPTKPIDLLLDPRPGLTKLRPGIVRFDDGWRAEFVPFPRVYMRLGYNDLVGAFNQALKPVCERQGIEWRRVGRFSGFVDR